MPFVERTAHKICKEKEEKIFVYIFYKILDALQSIHSCAHQGESNKHIRMCLLFSLIFYRFSIKKTLLMICYTYLSKPKPKHTQHFNFIFYFWIIKWILQCNQKNLINMKLFLIYKPHIDFIITTQSTHHTVRVCVVYCLAH